MSNKLISYSEVLQRLPESKHLLLGNGFSIGCDPVFNYPDLFKFATANGLSETVVKVFRHFGTNNFEGVMRTLEDMKWVTRAYGFVQKKGMPTLDSELLSIKNALVSAVAKTHLPFPSAIAEERKKRCAAFLEPYKNVFTTNYDLILYWVSMFAHQTLQTRDGFRSCADDPDAEYLVFREHVRGAKGVLFIHGALHLYVVGGEVRKHSWTRSNKRLIELVKDGLENGQYPLFVG